MQSDLELDTRFERCTGVAMYVVNSGADENVNVGYQNRTGVIHDRTDLQDHKSTSGVDFEGRYKTQDFEANGEKVSVLVEPRAALTADLTLQVVFRLENSK